MKKVKVLINFIDVGRGGFHIPWLLKFKYLELMNCELYLLSSRFIKKMDLANQDIYKYNETEPEFKKFPVIKWTKFKYITHAIKTNVKGLFQIKKVLKGNYDVIYSPSSVLDLILASYLVKKIDKKIAWTAVFDNIVPISDPGNKLVRFSAWVFFQISILLLRSADIVFASTPELYNYLIKRNFDKRKLVETGFAIEVEKAMEARADDRYNIDALFAGRINETKGIYDMLKVLKIVTYKYPNFQLAIMGEGDEITKKQFKEKINEMGLEKNIQFLGYRSGVEKYSIFKSSKSFWFLSVSKSESFGIMLLEAVCCGVPAFTYDLAQFPRVYPNGEVNISPKHDYKLVAKKVIELFDNKNFFNEKGVLLLEKYSWERIARIESNTLNRLTTK